MRVKSYICPACMKDNYRYLKGTDCLLRRDTDKPTCCMLSVAVKQLELPPEVMLQEKIPHVLGFNKSNEEGSDGQIRAAVYPREGDSKHLAL